MKLFLALLPLVAAPPVPQARRAGDPAQEPPPVEAAELGGAPNVHRSGSLWFAGQFRPEDLPALRASGIRRVVSVRADGELEWDEEALVEEAGLAFAAVPFRAPETLTDEVFDRVRALLAEDAGPTLLHCGSANRAGGAWLPYRVVDQGVPLERALAEARAIGLRTDAYRDLAVAHVERLRQAGVGREPSVRAGVNETFQDPDLDVDELVQRFEVESREIYAARQALLEACRVAPGMRVADVGAGTGLFTFLFSDAVAGDGWVFSVDIAPRLVQHVLAKAWARNVQNVTGVLCTEDSIGLPPASLDLAFVCDTYHHFEYPRTTLASIHRALRPGGRLVVVDFERIPGVSREWILGHVRAGKDVVRQELEAAGFTLVREIDVAGLAENYVLELEKAR